MMLGKERTTQVSQNLKRLCLAVESLIGSEKQVYLVDLSQRIECLSIDKTLLDEMYECGVYGHSSHPPAAAVVV